jgi:CheY-like chemotaxis protein
MSQNRTILIIDDNQDYAEAIKTILESSGRYKAEVATSTKNAVALLEKAIPDLIILDIIMQKGAEGIILSRKFKKDSRLSNVPIIMLTSITKQTGFKFIDNDPRHPRFLPVEEFIEKPVPPNKLLAKVEQLLSAKESPIQGQ